MLVLSPDGQRGYTANVSAGSVSVLDLTKRKLIRTIPVAKSVQRVSISPDSRRIFTHDQDAPRIAVIEATTNKISNWIALPDVAYASAPTLDGRWLLALSMSANRLHVVDLQTLKVVRSLEIPERSSEILIRPGGEIAYVSGRGPGKLPCSTCAHGKCSRRSTSLRALTVSRGSALRIKYVARERHLCSIPRFQRDESPDWRLSLSKP